jgi:dihydropteroate synthase
MGIINVTPDSFSDGGRFRDMDRMLAGAETMVGEGADILDVGGESTRPGAQPVAEAEELQRVVPAVEALRRHFDVPVSVDTSKAVVMRAAVAAGAGMINDVWALRRPGALAAARELGVPVCMVHMQGEPSTMQREPVYQDVVAEVSGFLLERVRQCTAAGLDPGNLVIDPGFGFGKQLTHNLQLLRSLPELAASGWPVLVGLSRKALVGAVTGRPVDGRMHGSVALAVYAALHGVSIVRVHDVGPTVDALRMIEAVVKETQDG